MHEKKASNSVFCIVLILFLFTNGHEIIIIIIIIIILCNGKAPLVNVWTRFDPEPIFLQ